MKSAWRRALLASLAGSLYSGITALGAPEVDPMEHLSMMSLDELLNIEVSTASRKEQRLSDTAAAVAVLTDEDIRRSGATHIAEALRTVPGVQVARFSAYQWAISVRGFNEVFANKLLVLVDGRSVYTPLFSGTLWEFQDLPLQTLDRVEVVRGPGASVWGANAVNGVINIITKPAKELQGGEVSVGGGTFDNFLTSAGYGAAIVDNAWLRVDANYRQTGELESVAGGGNGDDWRSGTGRLRLDWEPSDTTDFTLIGGGQYAEFGQRWDRLDLSLPAFLPDEQTAASSNAHLLGRWTHRASERSTWEFQSYLDYYDAGSSWLRDQRFTFDVGVSHRWQPNDRHDFNWGIGYRVSTDQITTFGDAISVPRAETSWNLFSGYLQEDFQVVPDKFSVTAGVRLEHHEHTDFELQPTLRGLWKINQDNSIWLSASRAVRTPSRSDVDATGNLAVVPAGVYHPFLPAVVSSRPNEDFASEELWAFEAGYRWQVLEPLNLQVAAFYNVYDQLRGSLPGQPYPNDPFAPSYLVIPLDAVSDTSGNTLGAEASAIWQARENLRFQLGYSYLVMDLRGSGAEIAEENTPRHQLTAQPVFQVTDHIEVNAVGRFVDKLTGPDIPAYATADVWVSWRPRNDLEVSIVGQNLFDSPLQEFHSMFVHSMPSLIERSVYESVT